MKKFNYDAARKGVTHHPQWQLNRVKYIVESDYYDILSSCKTCINMGALFGDLPHIFREGGDLDITYINEEARQGNIATGEKKYPNDEFRKIDYETHDLEELASEKADLVINWGLLYHISKERSKDVLRMSIERTNKLLLFETEVLDWDRDDCFKIINTRGTHDQGTTSTELIPSIKFVTNVFEEFNVRYKLIESPELSFLARGGKYYEGEPCGHVYHWEVKNTKARIPGRRKFWVVTKK